MEVLVAMGLMLLLAGLLLPGVGSAQQSARAVQCKSRLGEIMKAFESASSAHGFPPHSYGGPANGTGSRGPAAAGAVSIGYSPHYWMLPHLEQQQVFDSYNLAGSGFEALPTECNRTAALKRIAVYCCPADDRSPNGAPGVSYRGCNGYYAASTKGRGQLIELNGPFRFNAIVKPAQVSDGLSKTAFFSEKLTGPGVGPDLAYDAERSFYFSGVSAWPASVDQIAADCSAARDNPKNPTGLNGLFWSLPFIEQIGYTHVAVPNAKAGDCYSAMPVFSAQLTARSRHPQAVNVGFGDGHVQTVSETVDLKVWRALATIAGGEALPDVY